MINVVEKNKVRDITAIGLMVALLCISSYIAFPLPFTPIMLTSPNWSNKIKHNYW